MARRGPAPFTGCGGPDGDWRRGHATSILARLTPECCTKHQSRAKRRRVHLTNQLPAMHPHRERTKRSSPPYAEQQQPSWARQPVRGYCGCLAPRPEWLKVEDEKKKNDCCRRRRWHHTLSHTHIHMLSHMSTGNMGGARAHAPVSWTAWTWVIMALVLCFHASLDAPSTDVRFAGGGGGSRHLV